MRIWVTRTAPENANSAARLENLGHEAVIAPVLEVRAVAPPPPRFAPDALIFTSMNGVRHHAPDAAMLDLPVFAVGDRTAAEAVGRGYRDVRSASGDVQALQLLIAHSLPPSKRILHVRGRDVAGDVRQFLRRFGLLVEDQVVYAAPGVPLRWLLPVRAELPTIGGILLHSPRAAERVARILSGTGWSGTAWCISEACAMKLVERGGIRVRVASEPTEAALIALIRDDARTDPSPRSDWANDN